MHCGAFGTRVVAGLRQVGINRRTLANSRVSRKPVGIRAATGIIGNCKPLRGRGRFGTNCAARTACPVRVLESMRALRLLLDVVVSLMQSGLAVHGDGHQRVTGTSLDTNRSSSILQCECCRLIPLRSVLHGNRTQLPRLGKRHSFPRQFRLQRQISSK